MFPINNTSIDFRLKLTIMKFAMSKTIMLEYLDLVVQIVIA